MRLNQSRVCVPARKGDMDSSWTRLLTDWEIPPAITVILILTGLVYASGWRKTHNTRPTELPSWRFTIFCLGLFSLFVAVASPLDTFGESLIFMHMGQHFVLMSVAPPLIVLGSPSVPILRGLPSPIVRWVIRPLVRAALPRRLLQFSVRPFVAWLSMNLAYLGWHIPRAYEFALSSEFWHNLEHLCFLVTSIQFWWVVIAPWPYRRSVISTWVLVPYILVADIVNTGLSALLCFSGRLLYPSYGKIVRPFGLDALKDQVAAGAFMWVFGSVVFLVAVTRIVVRLSSGETTQLRGSTTWVRPHALATTTSTRTTP
jgi:putative membrane protein